MINITDVRVRLFDTDSKIKAAVSITLDSCFVIHELRVIEGKTGLFVIMPGKKAKNGEADGAADEVLNETVTISRAEYENLLRIKAEYERSKK